MGRRWRRRGQGGLEPSRGRRVDCGDRVGRWLKGNGELYVDRAARRGGQDTTPLPPPADP